MSLKRRYPILIIVIFLLISQTTAWNIIRQPEVSNITQEALNTFLLNDSTNNHTYIKGMYDCGYFARDLARNASKLNITLGGVILGYTPTFRDYDNHIANYVYINGSLQFIEPQNDQLMRLNQTGYDFYKLYPNGKYVPSRW